MSVLTVLDQRRVPSHGQYFVPMLSSFCLFGASALAQPIGAADTASGKAERSIEITAPTLEYRQFNKVEVTGSSIVNPKAREALSVRIIDRKEIERTGAKNTEELLQRLPMMHSFRDLGSFNQSGKGPYFSAAIHGYEQGTLVLINGRRLAPVSLQRADLDRTTNDIGGLLPLSAIERVEILTDGASSLYGSDAIAGVINIITREETQGVQLSAENTYATTSGTHSNQIGLAWGRGKKQTDGYNLQAHLALSHSDPVLNRDQPWTQTSSQVVARDAAGQPLTFNPVYDEYGSPGKILRNIEAAADCPSNYQYALQSKGAAQGADSGAARYRCLTDVFQTSTLYPKRNDATLHVQFEKTLDSDDTLFAELGWQQRDVTYRRIAAYEFGLSTLADGQQVAYDVGEWSRQYRTQSTERQRLVLGRKGVWRDWDYKLSLNHSNTQDDTTQQGGFLSGTNWGTLLTPYASELLQPLSQASPDLQSALNSRLRSDAAVRQFIVRQEELLLTGSRTVGQTDWGDIQLGLLTYWGQQAFNTVALLNPSTEPTYARQRNNVGAAAELQWPAWAGLNLTAAARAERYSDFGNVLTGKLGGKYAITEQTYLRASAGTGFRAPTLAQLAPYSTRVTVPVASSVVNTPYNLVAYAVGNPDLQPEKSQQASLGLHSATPRWAMGVDWWQIRVRDAFGTLTADDIYADADLRLRYASVVNGAPTVNIVPLNMGTLVKNGLDYYVQHRWPMDAGRLIAALEGTYNLRSDRTLKPNGPAVSDLGTYLPIVTALTPRHRLRLSSVYETSQSGWHAAIQYMSGNTEPYPNAVLLDAVGNTVGSLYSHKVKSTLTLDVGGWYQAQRQLKLRWFITNVTNSAPPVRYINEAANISITSPIPLSDTRYNDYRGRTLTLRLEWQTK